MHRYEEDLLLPTLFELSTDQNPDHLAVVADDATLTYTAIEEASNHFARELREAGVGPRRAVLCALPRSAAALVAQLAILKSGAIYVPVDHTAPQRRLRLLAQRVSAAAAVVPARASESLKGLAPTVLSVDLSGRSRVSPQAETQPEDPAYIVFTSGSTGEPKGVVVSHRAIVSTTLARFQHYDEPVRRFLLVSPLTFDSALAGTWWTLSSGGVLEVAPDSLDGVMTAVDDALSGKRHISHTLMTPGLYLNALQRRSTPSAGPTVTVVAGEECPPGLVAEHFRLQPTTRLYNEYGPTEGAVWCAGTELLAGAQVSIGKPIARTTLRILDGDGRKVPDGDLGELWLGGSGLASGYHGDPDLTASRFVDHPDGRFYRTGDLGRFLDSGDITLHGRIDDQLKIRGHRIEPAEVEAVLRAHPDVAQAVVTAQGGRLVAHVVRVQPSSNVSRLA